MVVFNCDTRAESLCRDAGVFRSVYGLVTDAEYGLAEREVCMDVVSLADVLGVPVTDDSAPVGVTQARFRGMDWTVWYDSSSDVPSVVTQAGEVLVRGRAFMVPPEDWDGVWPDCRLMPFLREDRITGRTEMRLCMTAAI